MAEQYNSLIKGKEIGDKYALYNGDSAEVLKMMPEDSVHYIIYKRTYDDRIQKGKPYRQRRKNKI